MTAFITACEDSEFGASEWAQNYHCATDIDLPNSGDVSKDIDINSDSEQEKGSNDCDSSRQLVLTKYPSSAQVDRWPLSQNIENRRQIKPGVKEQPP